MYYAMVFKQSKMLQDTHQHITLNTKKLEDGVG